MTPPTPHLLLPSKGALSCNTSNLLISALWPHAFLSGTHSNVDMLEDMGIMASTHETGFVSPYILMGKRGCCLVNPRALPKVRISGTSLLAASMRAICACHVRLRVCGRPGRVGQGGGLRVENLCVQQSFHAHGG